MRLFKKQLVVLTLNVLVFLVLASTISNYTTSYVEGEAATYSSRFNSSTWGVSYGETWVSGSVNSGTTSSPRGIRVDSANTGANASTTNSYTSISKISLVYGQSNGSSGGTTGRGSISIDILESESTVTNVSTIEISAALSPNPKVSNIVVSSLTGKIKITVSCTTSSIVIADVNWTSADSPENDRFVRISNSTDLLLGRRYIISSAATISSNYFALSTDQQSSNRTGVLVSRNTTDNTIQNTSGIQKFTLQSGTKSNTYSFYTGTGYIYAAASSSNELKTEVNKSDNSSWSISFTGSNSNLIAQGTNTRNTMQFTTASSAIVFSCYSSASQSAVELFMELPENSVEYSEYFLSATQSSCDALNVSTTLWNDILKPKYLLMVSSERTNFINISSEGLNRYNYIIEKYGFAQFD